MRTAAILSMTAATVLGIGVLSTGTASALGGETLVCRTANTGYSQYCVNNAAPSYNAYFIVQNETAPSTYSWAVSAEESYGIVGGCAATDNYCDVSSNAHATSNIITVSVTLTQSGSSETLTAQADLEPWCGREMC